MDPGIVDARVPHGAPRLISRAFLIVTFANFAYFITIGMLIPTLPRFVEGRLGGGGTLVGLVIGAFSFAAVFSYPFVGRLGDARGRRVLMVSGGSLVAVSTLAYVVADSALPLLGLRVLTGMGGALFYVGAASTINDLTPDARRAEALSYFSLALYGGLALGPVLGEIVLERGSFDLVWTVAAVSALIAGAAGVRVPDTRPSFDAADAVPHPRRLYHPAALLPGTVLATSVWGLAGFNAFIALYVLTLGMEASRLVFVVYAGVVLSLRALGARLPDRWGPGRAARAALACNVVGLGIIGLWAARPGVFVGTAVFATGQALAFPSLMTLAVRGAPASQRAAVIATFTAFFDLAFGLGALTLGGVADLLGYRGAFLGAAAVAGGGLVLLAVRARRAGRAAGAAPGEDAGAAEVAPTG